MNYEEFLKYCKDLLKKKENYELDGENLTVQWSIGGVTGGSCWGDSKLQPYVSDDIEKEFISLDIILEELKPQISYIQYRNLYNKLTVFSDSTDGGDYYGNYTNYKTKTISLKGLFDYMSEKEWLE